MIKLISNIKKYFQYKKNPKYVILRGVHIENRILLWLAKNPEIVETEEFGTVLQAEVLDFGAWKTEQYWRKKPYKIIWTYKELIDARRKLGKTLRKVMYDDFSKAVSEDYVVNYKESI